MKAYIILGAAGGYISGGPIYQRNKAIYMKENGWSVFYISTCHGEVYIKGLEQFIIMTCTFLCNEAYVYPKLKQKQLINYIIQKIPNIHESSEIVIESGTYYTAYWGELLARELHAKHVIIYLDENNDGFTSKHAVFFKFKFDRNELACIRKETMIRLFSEYWDVHTDNAKELICYCSNSIEDFNSDITDSIIVTDYNIGYIGRLEKNTFKTIASGVIEFAKKYSNKKISFICFGGAGAKIIDEIKKMFKPIGNVNLYISGYIYPIPLKAIQKCNIFISSAGSCSVSIKAGVPTLKVDIYTEKPIGFIRFMGDDTPIGYRSGNSIIDYLEMFWKKKIKLNLNTFDFNKEKELINNNFKEHITFLNNTLPEQKYYDISKIKCSFYQSICKSLISLFGNRIVKYLNI